MHPVALYVGAGTDLTPLTHLSSAHRLVCVDGQPFSEFGFDRCECHVDRNCFSRPRFLADLDREARRSGLGAPRHTPEHVRAYGDNDRVRYYVNTAIPCHVARLRHEAPFSTLVVRGHHPHATVLELLAPTDNALLGFEGTSYTPDYNEHTVVQALYACPQTRARFRSFTLVVAASNERVHCATWEDFVRLLCH